MLLLSRVYCCCPCNVTSSGTFDAGYWRPAKSFGRIHVTRAVSNSRRRHRVIELDESDWNVRGEEDLPPKPLGFGHGKSYDTSLEDKLLEEIERDKTAAAKKRSNLAGTQCDSEMEEKAINFPSSATMVKIKISDLPKKKNIKRDLLSAFRNAPGLLEVVPIVLGNEKTRDPVCKGFAFLTFDNYDHAKSFLSSYGDEPILFGKVMKQPSYKILDGSAVSACMNETAGLKLEEKETMSEASLVLETPSFEKENEFFLSNSSLSEKEQVPQFCKSEVSELEVLPNRAVNEDRFSYGEDEDDADDEYEIPENDIKLEVIFREDQNLEVADRSLKHDDHSSDRNESVSRITELENRLRKKLEEGRVAVGTKKRQTARSRGFKAPGSKQNPIKGNNLMAMTNKLKKNERTIMIGVLEKYGKHETNSPSW